MAPGSRAVLIRAASCNTVVSPPLVLNGLQRPRGNGKVLAPPSGRSTVHPGPWRPLLAGCAFADRLPPRHSDAWRSHFSPRVGGARSTRAKIPPGSGGWWTKTSRAGCTGRIRAGGHPCGRHDQQQHRRLIRLWGQPNKGDGRAGARCDGPYGRAGSERGPDARWLAGHDGAYLTRAEELGNAEATRGSRHRRHAIPLA